MKDGFLLKLFRMLAAIFDSAFVYLLFFLCLLLPIKNIVDEYNATNLISLNNIIILLCFVLLGCLFTLAYFVIFSLVFKGPTLGMKMFYIKPIKENNSFIKAREYIFRYGLMIILIIFTFGLSLISDIISIVLNKNSKTFLDQFLNWNVVRTVNRKEEV